MPTNIAANASGVCSLPGCSGVGVGKRAIRQRRSVLNATAQQICNAYVDGYLSRLSRQPHQRDLHYNDTIASARQMCTFDVMTYNETVGSVAQVGRS